MNTGCRTAKPTVLSIALPYMHPRPLLLGDLEFQPSRGTWGGLGGVPSKARPGASQPPPGQGVPAHLGETQCLRVVGPAPPQPCPFMLTGVQGRRHQGSRPQQEQRLGPLQGTGLHPGPAVPSGGADLQSLQFGVLGETRVWEPG